MSMKALVKLKQEPGLWLTEVDIPAMGHNDVLIKIKKTAICGTDLHIYNWDQWAQNTIPVPMAVGHEFMGEVIEVGGEVSGFKVGDRVSGEGHITCGYCRNCRAGKRHLCRNTIGLGVNRPGCFAEYLVLPATNAFKLSDGISDEMGSILDPFGNAAHTALSFDLVGEDVLITGAGPIGIMAVKIAKHVGARHVIITDINPYRLELARQMGADRAINIQETQIKDVMQDLDIKEGIDVGLEMSGHASAIGMMLDVMNCGGCVAFLGLAGNKTEIDLNQVIFKGLNLKGIYGREMFETWYKMANLLEMGLDISPVVTHRFHHSEYQEAFNIINSGLCGKVILEW